MDELFDRFLEYADRKSRERVTAPAASDWVSVATAMQLLSVGRTKLQQLKNDGTIRFFQDKKKLRFSRKSIEKYLNDHSS